MAVILVFSCSKLCLMSRNDAQLFIRLFFCGFSELAWNHIQDYYAVLFSCNICIGHIEWYFIAGIILLAADTVAMFVACNRAMMEA